jgi:hypothetical protein
MRREWIQGVGYAVAEIVRLHGMPSVAADVAHASGCKLADFVAAGMDTYDLKTLRKLARDEERRWK